MTSDPESTLFDFAASNRVPTNEEEKTVTELHAAIGTTGVPLRLRRPPVAPRFTRGELQCRKYMYAAVTLALVLAVATAGLLAVRQQSSTPSPTEVPEVVLGLAGQQSEGADATPVASPIASIMRDPHELIPGFGATERDMPVLITYVDSLSESKDWWPFNPVTSQFQIRFDSEREFAELEVRNGVEIHSTFYPNIFLAYHAGGVQIVNISSLTMITIQTEMSSDDIDRFNLPIYSSRWMVIQDANLVIDTLTMNVTALNEVLGITSDRFSPHRVSTNEDGSQLLVAITVWDGTQFQWRLAKFNPDGTAELIPTAESLPELLGLALSPDGERAVVRSSKVENNSSVHFFTVWDLSTGEPTDIYQHPGDLRTSDPVWIDNGNAFVYTNHGTLFRATPGDSDPDPLYEAQGTSLAIYKTHDPNTVVLIQNLSGTSPEPVEMDDPRQIILVNVATGELSVHQGVDQTMSPDPSHTYTRNVVMLQKEPNMLSGRELHVEVIDPVTGEQIGNIDREDPGETRPGAVRSGGGHKDGDMRFMSWGSKYTYQVTTAEGEAVLRKISPPPGNASEEDLAVGIRTSNDASWLAMHIEQDDEWWIADLTSSEPEWEQLPEFDQFIYVASAEKDSASLSSTPAASPVASATCEFDTDTPIIIGASSAQFEGTNLIITPSGEMNLVCGDSETTLATTVDFVFPTSAPNVVMVETSEGMRIINIATGDSLDFPYSAMIVLQNQHLVSAWGSWMVMPSSDDQTLASIVDLRTLTEAPITTSVDHRVQESAIAGLSVNTSDTHAVVAVSFNHSSSSRYLQGFFIVDAEGGHRFIHTQSDVLPRTITISPDGETIATSWYQGTMDSGETNISLYDAMDGDLIESWELPTGDIQSELTWLNDGSGLVFTDGTALYRLDAQHPGDGFQVLLEGPEVSGILLTPDPNVVAVSITEQQEQGPPTSKTTIVNLETGETLLLEGRDLWASSYGPTPTRSVLVLLDFFGWHAEDSLTLTVVDSVTGEEIGEIEHNPPGQISIGNATSQRNQGDVDIFSLSADTTWQLLDENDQPHLQQIPPPDGRSEISGSDLLVTMNGDGQVVITFFDPFEVWLWQPDTGEWTTLDVAPPDNDLGLPIVVMFIPGDD